MLVQEPGQFFGQTWESGLPYTWRRLLRMYELPDSGSEWEDVYQLQQQRKQERQLHEQAQQQLQVLSQCLRELEVWP